MAMKKNIYFSAFAASLLAMGFTSCSNEDFAGVQQENGTVRMTVGISKADLIDGETRTSLSENSKGDLDCVWKAGDQVLVTDKNGNKKGILTLLDGAETTFAHFYTENLIADNGKNIFNFSYLGTANDPAKAPANGLVLDFSNQKNTIASFSENDILFGREVEVNVAEGDTYAEDINLKRRVSFGHFELKFPEGVSRTNEVVTISCSEGYDLINSWTFNYQYLAQSYVAGDIKVNGSGNDLYVTIVPGGSSTDLIFNVTIDGKLYTGKLGEKTWDEGIYVRQSAGVGVPVEMTTDEPEVDHSKNPLLKWAESNLEYNKNTHKSSFVANPTDKGSLYQWGRNAGFSDYKDARGSYDSYEKSYNYYVTNANTFVHAGLNAPYLDANDEICLAGPMAVIGSSSDMNDADIRESWVMNSNTSSTATYRGDYWAWPNGGSDWKTRAENQGYKMSDLITDDTWRLPTSADFKEIMPKTEINTTSSSLTSALSNKGTEIRTNADCTYAIKWSKVGNALKIEALVVKNDATLNDVDWKNENVKVRFFPIAGVIRSTVYQSRRSSAHIYLDIIAAPLPLGDVAQTDNVKNFYGTLVQYATNTMLNDNSDSYGAYWVSDSKSTFTIVDAGTWKYAAGATAKQSTQFKMTTQNAHNGYSIRLIKK